MLKMKSSKAVAQINAGNGNKFSAFISQGKHHTDIPVKFKKVLD